ncbi:alpha/beta hydrolase family protein [Chitinimonas naiadis]
MFRLNGFFSLCLIGVLLGVSSTVFAAAEKPAIESFFKNPMVKGAALSPSGNQLATIMRAPNGRYVLAVAPTNALQQMKVAANFADADIIGFNWINESRLYLMVGDDKAIGSRFSGSEYAVNVDGSVLLQLTTGDWEHTQENTGTSIKNKILPWDYSVVSFPQDGSDDVIVNHETYNKTDFSVTSSRLFRLNTKTRQLRDTLSGAQPEKITGWLLDTKNEPRIGVTYDKGRVIYHLREFETGQWSEIGNFAYNGSEGFRPRFFDADNTLYVSAEINGGGEALFRYNLKTKKRDDTPFVSVVGFDFNGSPVRDSSTGKMLGLHYVNDARGTVWLDPRFKEYQKRIDGALQGTINTITCGNCSTSPVLLVRSSSDQQPTKYALYDVATDKLLTFAKSRPEIIASQMGERDFVHFPARDGMSIPAYITTPPGGLKGPFPTVVLVHGGPFVRGASWEWEQQAQFLASRGYLVIQPEFRGSTGFGFGHFKAGWKQWGLTMQDDLADAAKWAISKGMADPKRIAIAGGSYGGYAALMGLVKEPELFRCGISWAGVTDLGLLFSLATSDATKESLQYGARELIGDPQVDAEKFKASSPLVNAARITQPVLLAYGGADRRVPIAHGTDFRSAVSKTNKQVEWLVYPEEGHGWALEKNRYDFWQRVEAFLDKNLKSPN